MPRNLRGWPSLVCLPLHSPIRVAMSSQAAPLVIGVTGGAGHVGLGVCQLALAQGHTVIALDRSPTGKIEPRERYQYKQVDATDFEAYKAAVQGCTALIHLAALFNMHDDDGNSLDDRMQHVSCHVRPALEIPAEGCLSIDHPQCECRHVL